MTAASLSFLLTSEARAAQENTQLPSPAGSLKHFFTTLLGTSCADRRLHVFFFFRWRYHRRQSKRLYPQLATPSGGMVKVLVFFILDLVKSIAKDLAVIAFAFLRDLRQELPIQMIFRFRFDDAFRGDDLCCVRFAGFARHLHRFDQRCADVPNH